MNHTTRIAGKQKTCRRCLQRLPNDQFRRRYQAQDKRHTLCRECVNAEARTRRQVSRHRLLRSMSSEIRHTNNSADQIMKIVSGVAQQLGGMNRLVDEWVAYFQSEITPNQRLGMINTLMQMMVAVDMSRINPDQIIEAREAKQSTPEHMAKFSDDELTMMATESIRELSAAGCLKESLQWLLDNELISRSDLPS
jgi:hypothetical protein